MPTVGHGCGSNFEDSVATPTLRSHLDNDLGVLDHVRGQHSFPIPVFPTDTHTLPHPQAYMARLAATVARAALRLANASAAAQAGAAVTAANISALVEVSAPSALSPPLPVTLVRHRCDHPRAQCFGQRGTDCALARSIAFSPNGGGTAGSFNYYSGVYDVPRQPYIARLEEEATFFSTATYATQPGFSDGLRDDDRGKGREPIKGRLSLYKGASLTHTRAPCSYCAIHATGATCSRNRVARRGVGTACAVRPDSSLQQQRRLPAGAWTPAFTDPHCD